MPTLPPVPHPARLATAGPAMLSQLAVLLFSGIGLACGFAGLGLALYANGQAQAAATLFGVVGFVTGLGCAALQVAIVGRPVQHAAPMAVPALAALVRATLASAAQERLDRPGSAADRQLLAQPVLASTAAGVLAAATKPATATATEAATATATAGAGAPTATATATPRAATATPEAMSPPGRPTGEHRSPQHEASPASASRPPQRASSDTPRFASSAFGA